MRHKNLSLGELKTAYINHLMLRNLSPLGIRQVDQSLRFFLAFLEENRVKSVYQVSAEVLEHYKAVLAAYRTRKGQPLCLNTVRGRLFDIQRWFRFMRKKGYITTDLIAGVQPPPRIKRLPRGVMSIDEIKRVMAQPDIRSIIGYRDRTIMETLYSTGIRAAELANLTVQDVDFENKTVRVRNGKGGKERFVLISPPCVRFLDRYIRDIRTELAQGIRPSGNAWLKKYQTGGELLFLSVYGGPLTKTWLAAMMKNYIRRAGITRPVSPVHSFRHSIATHLMESGMDIRYVQVMLGHASTISTQIYTHVERKSLQKKLKNYHPSERRGFIPFLGDRR